MLNQNLERVLGAVAIITIIAAWVIGGNRAERIVYPSLYEAFPEADRFEVVNNHNFAAISSSQDSEIVIGYVAIAKTNGYGGPMRVAVAVDPEGNVRGISIIEHKESPAWVHKVLQAGFLDSLVGKSYKNAYQLGEDVDGVSGATITSRALAEAAMQGSRAVAQAQLGLEIPEETKPPVRFGIPEIAIICLYIAGYFGHESKFKYTNIARWATMISGMVVLGFLYSIPLTIADINKLLLGFWPAWQSHLYWYLLIGGIFLVFTADNKNPYCNWFCPFGAAQECLGVIGGAKVRPVGKYKYLLRWVQRGLAWGAIMIGMLFQNPGLASYEVFGVLFDLTGSTWQFAVLGIILIASLFIRRPWCTYLCPLHPIEGLFRTIRKWVIESWKNLRTE